MDKMTLEEFRRIRDRIIELVNIEQNADVDEEELLAEYYGLLDELLSHDLSDIPFEEWEGIYIFREGDLDFSRTHANLDFEIMGEFECDGRVIVDGCNVRNIHRLTYDDSTFDREFMDSHPEYFPDESLPEEVRTAFYEKRLQLADLLDYPILKRCANRFMFDKNYGSPSKTLVDTIGFENTMRLLEEYPALIRKITYVEDRFSYSYFHFSDVKLEGNVTYEAAKRYLFEQIMVNLRTRYGFELAPEEIPEELKEMYPETFVSKDALPERILNNYNDGSLSIGEIRYYYETLKKYDLEFGTKKSREAGLIKKYFGSYEAYFAKIPAELDHFFSTYFNGVYDDDKIARDFSSLSTEEIIREVIRTALNEYGFYYYLSEVPIMLKYISLSELVHDERVIRFIETFGIEKLIEFNNEHNFILESSSSFANTPFYDTFLIVLGSYIDEIQLEDFSSPDALERFIERAVIKIMESGDYHRMAIVGHAEKELAAMYPNLFFDRDKIKELLGDVSDNDLDNIISSLKNGISGYNTGEIARMLKKYPVLIDEIESKDIKIGSNYRILAEIFRRIPKRTFLEIMMKYGVEVERIFDAYDNKQLNEFIDRINSEPDYEKVINDFIYNKMCGFGHRQKVYDIRNLPESFKAAHPELFLPEDAPRDLVDAYYGNSYGYSRTYISFRDMADHPEWIPYLLNMNLEHVFERVEINIYSSEHADARGMSPIFIEGLCELLKAQKFTNEEILDFIVKYGKVITNNSLGGSIDVSKSKEEVMERLIESIKGSILSKRTYYNEKVLPQEFIDANPELFLEPDAPEELRNLFYQKKLSFGMISNHPEWIDYLVDKKFYLGFSAAKAWFDRMSFLSNREVLELIREFGDYLMAGEVDFVNNEKLTFEEARESIRKQIANSAKNKGMHYDEDLKDLLGDVDPSLFLAEDAPEELKDVFYFRNQTPLTFKLLKEHREWLPYLEGKAVLTALEKGGYLARNLYLLFSKYGQEEAIRIGLKNPDAVIYMLGSKPELLFAWYDRLKFIPHQMVMTYFPIEEIDSYASSGKKWSQIMRLASFTGSDENVLSLLKASYVFGVFAGDADGFHDFMELFSDVPKVLTEEQMNQVKDGLGMEVLPGDRNQNIPDGYYDEELEIVFDCYELNNNGEYVLVIDAQRDKDKLRKLRDALEKSNLDIILTPDKAHKLFGGFEMKIKPGFREFIMEHIEEILKSDEYISFIANMHKQWEEIKAVNSNRVLTLDLALAYIKSNTYTGVEVGNVALSEVSRIAGYPQDSFDKLQQIFNYGKIRTFSSIPRIKSTNNGYTYEILRLDDPLAVAIGTLTDCCQELGNAAESSMRHSMTSRHGRVFVIKDEAGNIVAQSWMWRNKNVICFDNIEIPDKAFTRASRAGMNHEKFAEVVYELYKAAAQEIIEKDEEVYKTLLEEGKITEEQYEALRVRKVTVGEGYNDIKSALVRNAPRDKSRVARPLEHKDPVNGSEHLYTSDSSTQYILAGEEQVPESSEETITVHQDDYEVLTGENMRLQDVLGLVKLELATKGDKFEGNTQVEEAKDFIQEMAWNYGLDPRYIKVITNPNFAIIYSDRDDEILIGDLLYNFKLDLNGNIDVMAKIIIQIRQALDQIGRGKKFNTSRLDEEQMKIFEAATKLDQELDEERGISHGTK